MEPTVASLPAAMRAPALSSKVIGGLLDHHRFPAVGAILNVSAVGSLKGSCTGTLIAPDVVLTARHCLPGHAATMASGVDARAQAAWVEPTDLLFVLGPKTLPLAAAHEVVPVRSATYALQDTPELVRRYFTPSLLSRPPATAREKEVMRRVEQQCGSDLWLAHSQERLRCIAALPPDLLREMGIADASYDFFDVALLFLETFATTAMPMPMYAGDLATQVEQGPHAIVAVGYGMDEPLPGAAVRPAHMLQRRVGRARMGCVADNMFQLMPRESTCFGDSGGPVVLEQEGSAAIIGIVQGSRSDPRYRCKSGSTHMRVDAYREWIDAALLRACQAGQRVPEACTALTQSRG